MLSRPKDGWTTVTLGNFKVRASFLLDVPKNCTDAAIDHLRTGLPLRLVFETEDYGEFYTISNTSQTFIFWDENPKKGVQVVDVGAKEVIDQIYADITQYLPSWCGARWDHYDDGRKTYLGDNLKVLKELLDIVAQKEKQRRSKDELDDEDFYFDEADGFYDHETEKDTLKEQEQRNEEAKGPDEVQHKGMTREELIEYDAEFGYFDEIDGYDND